jgi:hypothetical protein
LKGRCFGPIGGTIPAFLWKEGGKPRKTSERIVGIKAEIRTSIIQNTSQKHYRF